MEKPQYYSITVKKMNILTRHSDWLVKTQELYNQILEFYYNLYLDTLPDEVRLNKYGRFLRATSLDELPELANIVKGDMSIIGPRPLMARYLDYYTEEERKRHNVRPGLSGYAQVHGRNNVDWSERMKMDIYYAEHISFGMDVKILIDTMLIVLKREGISVEDMTNFDDFRKMQWEEERKEKAGEI